MPHVASPSTTADRSVVRRSRAVPHVWPDANAARRPRLRLARHRSTTANVASLYPAGVQAPLPCRGPLLGVDITAGGAGLCWDPFEAYSAGLVTNPNVFVLGEPGFAKSSLIKCLVAWSTAIYGPSRWTTITDPKGEYTALAAHLGLSTIRLEPGGATRINPLEEAAASPTSVDMIAAGDSEFVVQASVLYSLAATQLGRALSPLERKLVRSIVTTVTSRPRPPAGSAVGQPTLLDVLALLANPTGEMCNETVRGHDQLVRDGEQLRFALDELHTGPLAGMFDGPSTVTVDWDGPGLHVDLSAVVGNEAAMPLVMVAVSNWARQQRHRLVGRQKLNVDDEAYYKYRYPETVAFAQERRKLGRQYGEANIDICHRCSDLGAQADDGTATAKIAAGLLSDSATTIVFRQAAAELDLAERLLGLTRTERDKVARLRRGQALWKIADHSLIARHHRPVALHDLTDTDKFMRRPSLVTDIEQAADPSFDGGEIDSDPS